MKMFKALITGILAFTGACISINVPAIAHGALLPLHATGFKFIAPHNHLVPSLSTHSSLLAATTFHRLPGFSGSTSNFYHSARLLQLSSFSQGTLSGATRIITSGQTYGTFYENFSGVGTAYTTFPQIFIAFGSNSLNTGAMGSVQTINNLSNSLTFTGSNKVSSGLIPPAHLVGPGSARALENIYHNIAIGSYNAGYKTGISNVVGGQFAGTAYIRESGTSYEMISKFAYGFGNTALNTQSHLGSTTFISNPTSFLLLGNGKTLSVSNAFLNGTIYEGFGSPNSFESQGFWALAAAKNPFANLPFTFDKIVTIPSMASFITY
jgi:hypothetical protein